MLNELRIGEEEQPPSYCHYCLVVTIVVSNAACNLMPNLLFKFQNKHRFKGQSEEEKLGDLAFIFCVLNDISKHYELQIHVFEFS